MIEKKKKRKLRDRIPGWNRVEYFFLKSLAALVNTLPIEYSTWIARRIGDLICVFLPKRRKIAAANLNIAYNDTLSGKQKERLAREAIRNLATSLMEFFRIPSMLKEASDRFEFEGTEFLDAAFARGKGIIFVISHLGSWEYLAFLPYLRKYPCSVVVKETRNPFIYRWIQELRYCTRLNPIPKKSSVRQILSELKANHLVAILIDQWAGREGIPVSFFGKLTSTTSIPARLAKRNGAALVPGYCIRTKPGHYKIVIKPEVPFSEEENWESETTLHLNRLLEQEILKFPDQWTWGHRRWKKLPTD